MQHPHAGQSRDPENPGSGARDPSGGARVTVAGAVAPFRGLRLTVPVHLSRGRLLPSLPASGFG